MIFGLCTFHAVVQERKKFGPLGWNILYEFNDSDRECALLNLQLFCQDSYKIPWDALEYTTGEITYGGRVTDYWDQRTLKTILKRFFSPETLEIGYTYSDSGTYYSPSVETLAEFRNFIEGLPLIEEPEIFGMHENANIACQTKETAAVIVTIMEVQPREAAGPEGKSSDDIVFELADMIKERIMLKLDMDDAHPSLIRSDSRGTMPSLTTVLVQEVDRFNKLLRVIHLSLKDLQLAIKGLVVMSDQLEEVYKSFLNNQIPKLWTQVAYPSLKSLGSWIRDLELRLDFISVWIKWGQPNSFWLSGFFFPQGFMTGCLQTHARKYNVAIDELTVDFIVGRVYIDQEQVERIHKTHGKEEEEAYHGLHSPRDGVFVHGLFVDAGCFDEKTGVLCDPRPGEINPSLPVMQLIPVTKQDTSMLRYAAPLYKTSVRAGVLSTTGHSTNYVITVPLPTRLPESHWILRGTALLTQVTD